MTDRSVSVIPRTILTPKARHASEDTKDLAAKIRLAAEGGVLSATSEIVPTGIPSTKNTSIETRRVIPNPAVVWESLGTLVNSLKVL